MSDESRDDGDLVLRAARGSEVAFRTLYRRYATPVYRVAYGLLGDVRDSEDVTQETFVTAWRKLPSLRLEGDSLLPWLATICRFQSANRRRVQLRERARHTPLDDALPASRNVEADVLDADTVEAILREVARLSDLDREIFRLCIASGYGYQEAADHLGVAHGTVRNRLSRIRSRVRAGVSMEES